MCDLVTAFIIVTSSESPWSTQKGPQTVGSQAKPRLLRSQAGLLFTLPHQRRSKESKHWLLWVASILFLIGMSSFNNSDWETSLVKALVSTWSNSHYKPKNKEKCIVYRKWCVGLIHFSLAKFSLNFPYNGAVLRTLVPVFPRKLKKTLETVSLQKRRAFCPLQLYYSIIDK